MKVVGHTLSVTESLTRAAELKPDLVLVDFRLTDGTGADAASCIRQLRPETKLIFLTSDHTDPARFFFFFLMIRPPPKSPLFPHPTLFRSPAVSAETAALPWGQPPMPQVAAVGRGRNEPSVATMSSWQVVHARAASPRFACLSCENGP